MIFSMMIVLRKPFFFFFLPTLPENQWRFFLCPQTFLAKKKSPLLLSVYPFTIFNYSSDILKISKDLLFHARLKLQHI